MDEKQFKELEGLKKDITSLVISTAGKMDLQSLSRGYRNLIGIPFQSFGYTKVIQMLKEKCLDIFLFSGTLENPVLIPIITDSVKHIDELVTRQNNDAKRYKFKIKFDDQKYAYDCVITLCRDVAMFRIEQPSRYSDWLLTDIGQLKSPVQAAISDTSDYEKVSSEVNIQSTVGGALPETACKPLVLPDDCMNCLDTIPFLDLSHLVSRFSEVIVTEVNNPSDFWFNLWGEAHRDALERIMQEMRKYYWLGEGAYRRVKLGDIRQHQYVAAFYKCTWYRAVILEVLDTGYVLVRHIDYGTLDFISIKGLRYLLRKWSELPVQAIRGRLAFLEPPNAADWHRSASIKLIELCMRRTLCANIIDIDEDERIHSLELVDTTTDKDIYIREELHALGLAKIINEVYDEESETDDSLPQSVVEIVKNGEKVEHTPEDILAIFLQMPSHRISSICDPPTSASGPQIMPDARDFLQRTANEVALVNHEAVDTNESSSEKCM